MSWQRFKTQERCPEAVYECVCLQEWSTEDNLAFQEHQLQFQDAGPENVHRGPKTINEALFLGSLTPLHQWQNDRWKPKSKRTAVGVAREYTEKMLVPSRTRGSRKIDLNLLLIMGNRLKEMFMTSALLGGD